MSRSIPQLLLQALSEKVIYPIYAVEMFFDSGTLRLWTGLNDREIDEETYIGSRNGVPILSVDGVEESSDLSARNMSITLSGITGNMVQIALAEPYQNRRCKVYFGDARVSEVVQIFGGFINTMSITDNGQTSEIRVEVDSTLVMMDRASNRRYTSEDHKSRYPNDTFFDYVRDIQDKKFTFR